MTVEDSVTEYPLEIVYELPTHRLYLDNICIGEEGDYYLTWRAGIKYSYSRAGWFSSQLFYLQGSNERLLRSGGYRSVALWRIYGYERFNRPEDGYVYLRFQTGEILEINLNEVMGNESK